MPTWRGIWLRALLCTQGSDAAARDVRDGSSMDSYMTEGGENEVT